MEITCLLDMKAGLGESPVWSAAEQALYFVDITAPSLHRLNPVTGDRREWKMPSTIGCASLADDGGLLVALRGGIHHFNPRTAHLRFMAHPEGNLAGNRYNDGKMAPDGRFFVGTMDEVTLSRPSGALYRLDPDGRTKRMLEGLIVSNGLAWSADGKTMFHSDSKAQKLFCYSYANGELGDPRLLATPGEADGRPDGGATDMAGVYWSAGISAAVLNGYKAGEGRVCRFNLPCAAPTMPCFGGEDMHLLFITSARHHVAPARLREFPHSGAVFSMRMEVPGVPIPAFPMARLFSKVTTA